MQRSVLGSKRNNKEQVEEEICSRHSCSSRRRAVNKGRHSRQNQKAVQAHSTQAVFTEGTPFPEGRQVQRQNSTNRQVSSSRRQAGAMDTGSRI
jgi:hypothetical protein